ncbi:MAG TPA: tetratricopeptide repeat protein [Fimbriimonadaceae bacterium]|nr:tetratricopeptide repeat protein [Fimbriimonadaceae bacterium]
MSFLLLLASMTVASLAMASVMFGHHSISATQAIARSPGPSAAAVALRILEIERSSTSDPKRRAQSQAEAVGELSDKLWEDMWGPSETEDAQEVLPTVSRQITESFDWACRHDPDLAVRIIGNGHRIFKLAGPCMAGWPEMISRALSLGQARKGIEYGRLCCGFAFSEVYTPGSDQRALANGFRMSQEARDIFGRIHGADWDEANALRHMGMCCVKQDRARAKRLYEQALGIYEQLQDPRGIAQTKLSLAQMQPIAETARGYENRGLLVLDAINACRATGSDDMLGEAWGELRIYSFFQSSSRRLLEKFRSEELARASASGSQHDAPSRMLALIDCMEIDGKVKDDPDLARDIEVAFHDTQGVGVRQLAAAQVSGFYDRLCDRIGRTKDPRVLHYRVDSQKAFDAGRSMSDTQFLKMALGMLL